MSTIKLRDLSLACITSFAIISSTGVSAAQPAYSGANGKPFQAIQAQIDALSAATSEVLNQINEDLQDLQNQVNDATQRITDLELYRDSLELRLAELESDVEANAHAISDLENELGQVEEDIAELKVEVNKKQAIITGYCPAGTSIRKVLSDGSVTCEQDHDAQLITSYITSNTVSIEAGARAAAISPACNANYYASGGGFSQSRFDIQIIDSYPSSNTQWFGWGWNRGSDIQDLTVYVVCTAVAPVDSSRAP